MQKNLSFVKISLKFNSRKQRNTLQLMKLDSEEHMKLTIEKCQLYCDKINQLTNFQSDLESDRRFEDEKQFDDQMMFDTLKNVIREKREFKVKY